MANYDSNIMNEVKKTEYSMLKEFCNVCRQLHLQYYLIGGTLLGAVRHEGFIPWDDDIDVALKRSDYEIFIRKAQDLLPQNLFLQTYETDMSFPLTYAKLRNCDTTFIETPVKDLEINHGIFIDIFPLDYYPEGKIKRKIFEYRKAMLNQSIDRVFYQISGGKVPLKTRLIKKLSVAFYPSIREAVRKKDRLLKSVKDSYYIANLNGAWGDKEIVPCSIFDNTVMLKFEDDYYCVPAKFDDYLKYIYGEYIILPEEEQRYNHHNAEIIDTKKTYKEYLITH